MGSFKDGSFSLLSSGTPSAALSYTLVLDSAAENVVLWNSLEPLDLAVEGTDPNKGVPSPDRNVMP